ncbi:TetR-like C-terminal domain-containing protein [Paeniglutamicibacter sp. R2-26]|uniref:TetR-like C-terminal domain-containing protein n=1 Tax=Paeniglutamicibacter sp. R2-26 TaxID=3144417 RepID=UPI003EE64643
MPDASAPAPGTQRPAARPGRPRDRAIEAKVVAAARDLIRESNDSGDYTLAQLVERSGVSRAAIYRRWDSVRAVSVAALDADRKPIPLPAAASLRETLIRGYSAGIADIDEPTLAMVIKRLILGLRDPSLQRSYWERHVSRRREGFARLLHQARDEGRIRPDVDPEVVLDLINGLGYYQGVVRGEWRSEAARDRVIAGIELVCDGIGCPPATGGPATPR